MSNINIFTYFESEVLVLQKDKIAIFVSSADLIHVVILSETRKYLVVFRGYRYFIDLTLHPLNWGLIMVYFLIKCIIYHFCCRHLKVNAH